MVLIALSVVGLGLLYALQGRSPSSPWPNWIGRAGLAAGAALAVGWLTLGLPGGIVAGAVLDLNALPPDAAWPLAIIVTQVGAIAILPASLVLRVAMPNTAGWAHAGATAALTLLAMCTATYVAVSSLIAD